MTDAHGGARPGAGRKRLVLPTELRERLGPPPVDKPLKLARWYSAAMSELVWLYMTTGQHAEMLREVRAAAGAIGRVMPMDAILEAARQLKADDDELDEDTSPDEETRPDGARARAVRRDAP